MPLFIIEFLSHSFFKPEHAIRKLLINLFRHFGIPGIRVMAVIEFHNMKSAAVDIKMNITLFKIGCDSFPELNLGMNLFHLSPCGIPYSLLCTRGDTNRISRSPFSPSTLSITPPTF